MLFMGIDVGTQGVRCVVSDECGQIAAARSVPFETLNISQREGWYEQSPQDWARAAEQAILGCTCQLANPQDIQSISIDGTSGTIVPLDADMRPLTDGIMYNDPRAKAQAARIHETMGTSKRSWATASARPSRCPAYCGFATNGRKSTKRPVYSPIRRTTSQVCSAASTPYLITATPSRPATT